MFVLLVNKTKLLMVFFPLTLNRSTFLFEFVHTDIWNSVPIKFHSSHFYYIQFLDNFSEKKKKLVLMSYEFLSILLAN